MTVEIHPISLGIVNCYLLKADGTILVDAGFPGRMDAFFKSVAKSGIQPNEIELVIITHAHIDHLGLACEIKERTGAKIAIHQRDREWLESGTHPVPPGINPWGKLLHFLGRFIPTIRFAPAKADIIIEDDGLSLHEFGLPGRVIHTPGHTLGSVSVLLDSGEAFVGDLFSNTPVKHIRPEFPDFADDVTLLKTSSQKLLRENISTVYSGHGKPFSPAVIREALS